MTANVQSEAIDALRSFETPLQLKNRAELEEALVDALEVVVEGLTVGTDGYIHIIPRYDSEPKLRQAWRFYCSNDSGGPVTLTSLVEYSGDFNPIFEDENGDEYMVELVSVQFEPQDETETITRESGRMEVRIVHDELEVFGGSEERLAQELGGGVYATA